MAELLKRTNSPSPSKITMIGKSHHFLLCLRNSQNSPTSEDRFSFESCSKLFSLDMGHTALTYQTAHRMQQASIGTKRWRQEFGTVQLPKKRPLVQRGLLKEQIIFELQWCLFFPAKQQTAKTQQSHGCRFRHQCR